MLSLVLPNALRHCQYLSFRSKTTPVILPAVKVVSFVLLYIGVYTLVWEARNLLDYLQVLKTSVCELPTSNMMTSSAFP